MINVSEFPQLHHQLLPMTVSHQREFPGEILESLRELGHTTEDGGEAGGVLGAIARTSHGRLVAVASSKKAGTVAGLNKTGGEGGP